MPTKKQKHGAAKREHEPAPTVLPAISDDNKAVSTVAALADIPEEEIWLAKRKASAPAAPTSKTCCTSCAR
jgi:hypothetical protein